MSLRDIVRSELTGVAVHIAHVSTAGSVRTIQDANARDVRATAGTAAHWFKLTEYVISKCGFHAKINPLLGTKSDRMVIGEGLTDETIDAITIDHVPLSRAEKTLGLDLTPNGIIGLENSVVLSLKLVKEVVLPLTRLIEKMSTNPAGILELECGLKASRPSSGHNHY